MGAGAALQGGRGAFSLIDANLLEAVAAVLVALAAITTSIAFGVLILRLDRRRRREAVERQFCLAIQDLAEVRTLMLAANARTLGEDYDVANLNALLTLYANKLSLHVSRAVDLIARHGVRGAPAEHLLLASALVEQGRIAEARPHYEIARQGARDRFAAAELGRMYGQAVFTMGNVEAGRHLVQRAGEDFLELALTMGYDKAAMLVEHAETHRQLFELEWRQGEYARAIASLSTIKSTRDNMPNAAQRARLTRMIGAIAEQLKTSPQLRASGALSLVEDRAPMTALVRTA